MSRGLNDTRSAVPVLVIVLGLAASFFTWSVVSKAEREADQKRFRQRAQEGAARLDAVVRQKIDLLRLLQGAYALAPDDDAAAMLGSLGRVIAEDEAFEPLAWVAWVRRVAPADLDDYLRARRADAAGAGFVVRGVDGLPVAEPDDDARPAGRSHWVMDQVTAREPAGRLLGLDLGTDDGCRRALEEAESTGAETVARVVGMAGDGTSGGGVLVALPVGGESLGLVGDAAAPGLRGLVVGCLDVEPLLEQAFTSADDYLDPAVNVVLQLQQVTLGSLGMPTVPGGESADGQFTIAGKSFVLQMGPAEVERRTVAEWLDRTSVILPPAIFVVMCLVSWIVWAQQRQTAVIREQVTHQTTELRQKNLVLLGKERELEEANQRLLEMSNTDSLTGILNRRAFEKQLEKERDRSRRSGVPFGLLIFDIDGFKDYNDRYGHPAGDEVLRSVAQLINSEARRIDCVARYGGEEFVVLASGCDAPGLMALGERVRQRVQQAALENAGSPHGVVTLSGGGALSSATDGADPRPVFDLADRCLYQAKTTGRNRVVMVT